ncbi:putative Ig domain-containing protein [Herbiconiux sp. YIM B11900]|uniref:putative Ig domain-containing protein n=1 Tax=Herbiconiux sp. YIM B11900 TaxID=3404131 RepID=UPI003F8755E7
MRRPRRPSKLRLAALIALTAGAALLAPAAAVTSASASAEPLPASAASTGAASGAADSTEPVGDPLPVVFSQVRFQHFYDATGPSLSWDIVPDWKTGTVHLVNNQIGACLYVANNGPHPWVDRRSCSGDPNQRFTFIPWEKTPTSAPDTPADKQFFYIASAVDGRCIWSGDGGLNLDQGDSRLHASLYPCSSGDVAMAWKIQTDVRSGGVDQNWAGILKLATVYASQRCADTPDSCQVAPDAGPYAGQWFDANDPDASLLGSFTTTAAGCGNGPDTSHTNKSTSVEPLQVSGTLEQSSSLAITTGASATGSMEHGENVLNLFSYKLNESFTIGEQTASAVSGTTSVTRTVSSSVEPARTLTGLYSQTVYRTSGQWKMGRSQPGTPRDSMAWSIPVRSTVPVSLDGAEASVYSPTVSFAPKNCTAGPAAAATTPPVITDDPATCGSATPSVPTGAVLEVLSVCPGDWGLKEGEDPLRFSYSWYLTQGGLDGLHPVLGSIGSGSQFTIRTSTTSATVPTYLGVTITEIGSPTRLDSPPTAAGSPILIASTRPHAAAAGASGASTIAADASQAAADAAAEPAPHTLYLGALPSGVTGEAYDSSLVADPAPGADIRLAEGSIAPPGLSLSRSGELSGVPTDNGRFVLRVVDSADATAAVTEIPVAIDSPVTSYRADTALTGAVGQQLTLPLVTAAAPGMVAEVTGGSLPAGLSLDPTTGTLTGVPLTTGTSRFTVANTDADAVLPTAFVLEITETPSLFGSGAAPAARVGEPYSAGLMAASGSGTLLLLGADDRLPAGLGLNARTGVLSGTPTEAGTTTVTLVDSGDPDAVGHTVTVSVLPAAVGGAPDAPPTASPGTVPAGAASGATPPGALAATGIDAAPVSGLGFAALAALALGAAGLITLHRRRAGEREARR